MWYNISIENNFIRTHKRRHKYTDIENPARRKVGEYKYGISPDDVESFADDAFEKRLCLSSVIGFLFDAYGDAVPPQKYFELAAKEASRLGFAIEKCSAAEREGWLAKKYDVRSLVPAEERCNVWNAIEMLALGGHLSDAEKDRFWDMIVPSLSKANNFFADYQVMCLDKRKKVISSAGVIALAKAYGIRPEDFFGSSTEIH